MKPLVLLITLLMANAANACEDTCLVADPSDPTANIRSAPNAAVLGTVRNGIEVLVLERHGKWIRIATSENKIGWMHASRLNCNH